MLTLLDDPEWSSWSDREIARHCGVTHPFVGKLRQRFADLSGNDYQMTAPRTVHRGDQTYTLDPSRIGHQATPIHMNGQVGDDRQEDGSSDPPSAPDHQGQRPAVAPDTPRGSVDLCPQKEDGPTSVDTWLKLVREMCSLIDSLAEQGGLTTLAQRWSPASQAELLAELQALTTPLVALQEELQAVCTTVDLHGPGEATM